MTKFLPSITRNSLEKLIQSVGITPPTSILDHDSSNIKCEVIDGIVTIGKCLSSYGLSEASCYAISSSRAIHFPLLKVFKSPNFEVETDIFGSWGKF